MSDEMNIGETGPNFKRGWARRFGSPSMRKLALSG